MIAAMKEIEAECGDSNSVQFELAGQGGLSVEVTLEQTEGNEEAGCLDV